MKLSSLILASALGLVFFSCAKDDDDKIKTSSKISGYIYTTTNGEGENQVVRFNRNEDGSLSNEKAYKTGSNGGANVNAGGDAHGDFDAQGAVQIIDNYLLNVNAGGNTVSVFQLNKTNGDLTFKENVNSGGTRPVSITYKKKDASGSDYWVVVGNQWNNPNIQKEGTSIERYPNDAWFNTDLTASDPTDKERNIALFSFNAATGKLTFIHVLDTYVRANGGPTTVSFNADGSKLAVSTWGIAHFMTPNNNTKEQRPSRVYVYDFLNDGSLNNKRYFEEIGIAGTIGFSWSKTNNAVIYASNFNLVPDKRANSVTVLKDNGTSVTKINNSGTTPDNAINEACWTVLSPDGSNLYVSNFASNKISTFTATSEGVNYVSTTQRVDHAPAGDTKDMFITNDGKYMYVLGAFQSFSINSFNVTAGGVDYKKQYKLQTTTATGPGAYNFLGLNGFDL